MANNSKEFWSIAREHAGWFILLLFLTVGAVLDIVKIVVEKGGLCP
jgi:hypothetical protein